MGAGASSGPQTAPRLSCCSPFPQDCPAQRGPVLPPRPYCSLVLMGPCTAPAQTGPHPALWVPDLLPSPCPTPALASLPSPSSPGSADPGGLWAVPCAP